LKNQVEASEVAYTLRIRNALYAVNLAKQTIKEEPEFQQQVKDLIGMVKDLQLENEKLKAERSK
jgi:hypothetical protein